MNFEEKIDAMRMTLELAMLDIEALRVRTEALQASIQEEHANVVSLRIASASQADSIRDLATISQNLVTAVQAHDQRIGKLERRA